MTVSKSHPMTKKVFVFHSDPGHGWLAVKRSFLRDLGILGKVSRCSFQRGQTVYLEEDCDMLLFLEAFEEAFDFRPDEAGNIRFSDNPINHSPVRSYHGFVLSQEEKAAEPLGGMREDSHYRALI